MSKSIVMVGMNIRAFARSATKAGLKVTALGIITNRDALPETRYLSLMDDLGGIFPPSPDAFHERICRAALQLDGDTAAYSGGFENYPELVGQLAGKFELLGNAPEALEGVRNPRLLQEAAAEVGIRTPRILAPGTLPDPASQWLKKPVKSGAGIRIETWDGAAPDDPDFIIQERIEGAPQSVSFVANGKEARIFAFSEQIIGDPAFGGHGYDYIGNFVLPPPPGDLVARLGVLANHLTRTFGLVGLNGIDFILHDGEPYVLEVNPRFSASMELVEDALGGSIFGWHMAGCRGEALPDLPDWTGAGVYGKATVHSLRSGIIRDTDGWVEQGRRDVPNHGMLSVPGFPICTVAASGDSTTECYESLKRKAAEVLAHEPGPHGFATLKFLGSQLFGGKNKGMLKALLTGALGRGRGGR